MYNQRIYNFIALMLYIIFVVLFVFMLKNSQQHAVELFNLNEEHLKNVQELNKQIMEMESLLKKEQEPLSQTVIKSTAADANNIDYKKYCIIAIASVGVITAVYFGCYHLLAFNKCLSAINSGILTIYTSGTTKEIYQFVDTSTSYIVRISILKSDRLLVTVKTLEGNEFLPLSEIISPLMIQSAVAPISIKMMPAFVNPTVSSLF